MLDGVRGNIMSALETSVLAADDAAAAEQPKQRVIKKYPNRRLYDTVQSRYITLADVRELVLNEVDFVVIDKKTQEDITRCILLQVICEQEQTGPLLSPDFLTQVIRCHAGGLHSVFAHYLDESLRLLGRHQSQGPQPLHQA